MYPDISLYICMKSMTFVWIYPQGCLLFKPQKDCGSEIYILKWISHRLVDTFIYNGINQGKVFQRCQWPLFRSFHINNINIEYITPYKVFLNFLYTFYVGWFRGKLWLFDLCFCLRQQNWVEKRYVCIVKLRQGSGKDGQGMALKAKGLQA